MNLIATDEKTGERVLVGATVTSFRGEKAKLVSLDRPRVPGKSGKVTVEWAGRKGEWEYYDGVFDLRVEEA